MGEFFKSWITAVATGSIVCGILMMLSPSAKNTKFIKIGISLYMLLVVFIPFVNGSGFQDSLGELEGTLRKFDFSYTDYQDSHSLVLNEYLGERLREEIKAFLSEEGMTEAEVSVEIEHEENGSYRLSQIYIHCENASEAAMLVKNKFQVDGNIIVAREKTQ